MADLPYYFLEVNEFRVQLKIGVSADEIIRDNLGEMTLEKIESRLLERYRLSVNQSILEFEKFDIVLREFFGAGAEGLEEKILNAMSH